MKHVLASAILISLLAPFTASADEYLAACKKNFPQVTFTRVTSVTEKGSDYFVTVNGKTFKAVFQEENFFSFLTAIGGGKITLFADAKGNIYGPDIAGNDSMVSARERACIKF